MVLRHLDAPFLPGALSVKRTSFRLGGGPTLYRAIGLSDPDRVALRVILVVLSPHASAEVVFGAHVCVFALLHIANLLHISCTQLEADSANRDGCTRYFTGIHMTGWGFPFLSIAVPTITPASLMSSAVLPR